jgi:UDP-3-O-[3-hydroxymyristoyl] glucosamine N-acyltransferase
VPVLLSADQAPTLSSLLDQANTVGLEYKLAGFDKEPTPTIRGIGSLLSSGPSEVSFLSNPKLIDQVRQCRAAAVILTADAYETLALDRPVVVCGHPYLMYALLAQWFDQHRLRSLPKGIHDTAVVAPSAVIAEGVSIGPHCVIESHVHIGSDSRIGPGTVLGANSRIGADCLLHARVTVYHDVRIGNRCILHSGSVIGADGFGFAPAPQQEQGAWAKIAQVGSVEIGDDVEIGANTTIDRGALENTVIGHGVKLDNQIMVAHNVRIGDHTAIAACVGIAGSTSIGRRCTIAGAAMLSGHIHLADDVHISGGTAITSSIDEPGRYTGVYPFAEHKQWQRNAAVVGQLAQLRRRTRALEKHENSDDPV